MFAIEVGCAIVSILIFIAVVVFWPAFKICRRKKIGWFTVDKKNPKKFQKYLVAGAVVVLFGLSLFVKASSFLFQDCYFRTGIGLVLDYNVAFNDAGGRFLDNLVVPLNKAFSLRDQFESFF